MRISRLGHKKSRNGCLHCKRRHVKCDEKRPCGNCVKYRETCSLVTSTSPKCGSSAKTDGFDKDSDTFATSSNDEPDTDISSGRTSAAAAPRMPSPMHQRGSATAAANGAAKVQGLLQSLTTEIGLLQQNMNSTAVERGNYLRDLRLMHHYSKEASFSLVDHPSLREFWQTAVPDMAFSCDFLLHGMLAFSALHLTHVRASESSDWESVSKYHQSVAVSLFSERLNEITEDNVGVCFLHACFIFMLETHSIATSSAQVHPADIAGSFILLQGVRSIMLTEPGLGTKNGALSSLINRPRESGAFPGQNLNAQVHALLELNRSLESFEGPSSATQACSAALDALLDCFQEVDALHLYSENMWLWAITLQREFVDLINSEKPLALLIVAHYAALLRYFEKDRWYIQGWSTRVISAIQSTLEPPWNAWMEWPLDQLDNINSTEIKSSQGSQGKYGD